MPRYDFTIPRLFVDLNLAHGSKIALDRGQSNYLLNVLRRQQGDTVLLFNGRDGEWLASVHPTGRKQAYLEPLEQTRPQPAPSTLRLLVAPLKQARMEYMVQKAVEMGVGSLQPVITEYTQLKKINRDKMQSHALEAAEQCGILAVPDVQHPLPMVEALANRAPHSVLIFCDEGHDSQNPLPYLQDTHDEPIDVIVGPEGGFSEAERTFLKQQDRVTAIPLGPRILRADTACVAALAVVQATIGDW